MAMVAPGTAFLQVISNAVDVELFSPRPAKPLRDKLGIGKGFVIGFVGTIREWVDLEPVFAEVSQLRERCPEAMLLIVGEEGGLEIVKRSARKHGVLDKTILAGTVPYEQVPDYIACMDGCLIPFARGKGMDAGADGYCPLKLAEYLACERPVISTQKTVMPAGVVEYAVTADECRHKIWWLYRNPRIRREMGLKGRSIITRDYTWSKSAAILEQTLLEAAS
jgi:glycosyltransferase involved in cell wall biosynthesis